MSWLFCPCGLFTQSLRRLGDEVADVFTKKFGPIDDSYDVSPSSTDMVSHVLSLLWS